MKKAFTLIELLVVIAIIAILAAILFPVFAQAKSAAKKTSDLSNNKQIGTATAIYLSDSDDLYPLQSGQGTDGSWGFNYNKYVPADWSANPGTAQRPYFSSGFFMNTVQPYVKNTNMLAEVGAPVVDFKATETVASGKTKAVTNYAYNGYLSSYSSTSVASPAMLPLLTGANGNNAGKGWGFANPALGCPNANQPCVYVPGTPIAGTAYSTCSTGNGSGASGLGDGMYQTYPDGTQSYWAFSKGQNWAYADGHAKFKSSVATSISNGHISATDPWVASDSLGHSTSYYWDGCHAFLFRPDYDFSFQNL